MPTTPQSTLRGREGERLATDFLRRKGFQIKALNWRNGRYELDIVATRWDEIHFVEVKTRSALGWTTPAEAITKNKFEALKKAASAYMAAYRVEAEPQFDLVSVEIFPNGEYTVALHERAMEWGW